jgi:hypothetical protein
VGCGESVVSLTGNALPMLTDGRHQWRPFLLLIRMDRVDLANLANFYSATLYAKHEFFGRPPKINDFRIHLG